MKKNILWNTFGNVFYGICTWVITILVANIASFESAGYLSMAMSTSSTFQAIAWFSMRNYQVTDVKGKYSDGQYVSSRILTCMAAYVLLIVAVFGGHSVYQKLCTIAFMPVRIAESLSDVFHGIDQKKERYDLIGKSFLIRGLGMVAIFVAGFMLGGDLLIVLVLMSMFDMSVSIMFDGILTNGLTTIKLNIFDKKIFELLIECLPLVIFTFFLGLQNNTAKNVIQSVCGTKDLGIYSSIASPTLIVQVMAAAIFTPFLPALSKEYLNKNYDNFRMKLKKIYISFIVIAVVITIGAMLLGKLGLTILFGTKILNYYGLFIPVVWVTILTAIVLVMQGILVTVRSTWIMTIGMVVDFLILKILAKLFVNKWGMNGANYIQILAFVIYILFSICVVNIVVKMKEKDA